MPQQVSKTQQQQQQAEDDKSLASSLFSQCPRDPKRTDRVLRIMLLLNARYNGQDLDDLLGQVQVTIKPPGSHA